MRMMCDRRALSRATLAWRHGAGDEGPRFSTERRVRDVANLGVSQKRPQLPPVFIYRRGQPREDRSNQVRAHRRQRLFHGHAQRRELVGRGQDIEQQFHRARIGQLTQQLRGVHGSSPACRAFRIAKSVVDHHDDQRLEIARAASSTALYGRKPCRDKQARASRLPTEYGLADLSIHLVAVA